MLGIHRECVTLTARLALFVVGLAAVGSASCGGDEFASGSKPGLSDPADASVDAAAGAAGQGASGQSGAGGSAGSSVGGAGGSAGTSVGGAGGSNPCTPEWTYGEWSSCDCEGMKSRTKTDAAGCAPDEVETQPCRFCENWPAGTYCGGSSFGGCPGWHYHCGPVGKLTATECPYACRAASDAGARCTADAGAISDFCDEDKDCETGRCKNDRCCVPLQGTCSKPSDCCSGRCAQSQCILNP